MVENADRSRGARDIVVIFEVDEIHQYVKQLFDVIQLLISITAQVTG